MKTLYHKLILGFLISIIISFSIAGFIGLRNQKEAMLTLTVDRLDEVVESLEEDPDVSLQVFEKASDTRIILIDQQGTIIYGDSYVIKPDDFIKVNNDFICDGNNIAIYRELSNGNYVIVTQNIHDEQRVFEDAIFMALGLVFVIGSFVYLILSDVVVKPIIRLTKASQELAKGNYHVKVNYYGRDEIANLANSFNFLADRLVKTEENRQKFISDVSHEFQTPLTSIQGFAKILTAEQVNDAQRRRYANIIMEQSQRLSTLSKNMMQLTMLESDDIIIEKSKYSIIEQLNRIIEMQQNAADEKNIEIEKDYPKGDLVIVADENRMEQVFINLISNAIKYTMNDGVIRVVVKKTLVETIVSIEDTGVGMNAEAVSHVFDRFYRADRSRSIQGNGLGLSIVKRIIDLQGFKIDVQSQEEVGSIFTVVIPNESRYLKK